MKPFSSLLLARMSRPHILRWRGSTWRNDVLFVLYRLTKKCVGPVQQRALSGADAVNALRPFYFAVHPDFFAQYPKERVGVE